MSESFGKDKNIIFEIDTGGVVPQNSDPQSFDFTPLEYQMTKDGELKGDADRILEVKVKLDGRGQPGLAAFYGTKKDSSPSAQILIKEDNPATCILEGTAYFAKNAGLLPVTVRDAANFAKVGTLKPVNGTDKKKIVSIQPRVCSTNANFKVKPLDEVVYGKKRDPKTLVSQEWWNADDITKFLSVLNPDSAWQLAAGIVYSQIVGDESLHLGQFMAEVDSNDKIMGIKRIDFGARERFARVRDSKDEEISPYSGSSSYANSGQLGKDYLALLLNNPSSVVGNISQFMIPLVVGRPVDSGYAEARTTSLKDKITLLWVDIARRFSDETLSGIKTHSKNAIIAQFNILDDIAKETALKEILDTVNKKCDSKSIFTLNTDLSINDKVEKLADMISELDYKRVKKLKGKALAQHKITMETNVEKFYEILEYRNSYTEKYPKGFLNKDQTKSPPETMNRTRAMGTIDTRSQPETMNRTMSPEKSALEKIREISLFEVSSKSNELEILNGYKAKIEEVKTLLSNDFIEWKDKMNGQALDNQYFRTSFESIVNYCQYGLGNIRVSAMNYSGSKEMGILTQLDEMDKNLEIVKRCLLYACQSNTPEKVNLVIHMIDLALKGTVKDYINSNSVNLRGSFGKANSFLGWGLQSLGVKNVGGAVFIEELIRVLEIDKKIEASLNLKNSNKP